MFSIRNLAHNRPYRKKVGGKKKTAVANTSKIEYTEDGLIVTTLYLKSLSREIKRDHLLDHFSKFGKVQNVRIHRKPTHSFGFVTFTNPESAAKALSSRFHEIVGTQIAVAIADSWHQDRSLELRNNHKDAAKSTNGGLLPIELTNATGTQLLDLNDDCLYEIFSLKFISIMDLCSVAESSTRLKQIANRIFTGTHKICHFNSLFLSTIYEARRLLLNFGPLINELWIGPTDCCENISTRVLDLVVRYCGKTLESLNLIDYEINEYMAVKLRPLFKVLQKLYIKDGTIEGASKALFASCESLVELKVINFNNCSEDIGFIIENTFPKLERFKFKQISEDYDEYNWELFLSRHKNLKTFSLKAFDDDCSHLLPIIAENCKQLENLQIKGATYPVNKIEYETALNSLLTLDKLKKLKIRCNEENVTKFIKGLNSLKSLEFLQLWQAEADSEFIPALSQLKNLHVLRLTYCSKLKNLNPLGELNQLQELSIRVRSLSEKVDFNLVNVLTRLINLKTLVLEMDTLKLDQRMYLKIVDAVRGRPGREQHCLEIFASLDDHVMDLQYDGNNRQTVKLEGIYEDYLSSDDSNYSGSDLDDDDDDDDEFFINPFLLPFLDGRLIYGFPNADSSDDEDDDDYLGVDTDNEVW